MDEPRTATPDAPARAWSADDIRSVLPIDQFYAFHADVNLNFQLNRSLIPGEEDLFFAIAARLSEISDWKREFLAAAEKFESEGVLGKAAHMYRAAEFFMSAEDPDRRGAYDKFMDLYYRSDETTGFERFEVPFADVHLHTLRLPASGIRRGTVVVHGGFDSYLEEFLGIARAFGVAGYDVIMFDGPGQGTTLMREQMTMTPHWHLPVGAVLDHFGVEDVTLVGVSLGGCLALRAAASEPRITRVVAFDAMLDFFDCVTSANGKVLQRLLATLLATGLTRVLDGRVRAVMATDYKARWGIEQGMHVTGTSSPSEFFTALRELNTTSISSQIGQHVLVMSGAEDHFVPAHQFSGQLEILDAARSVASEKFTADEHAQSHCQVGNHAVAVTRILHWIQGHQN